MDKRNPKKCIILYIYSLHHIMFVYITQVCLRTEVYKPKFGSRLANTFSFGRRPFSARPLLKRGRHEQKTETSNKITLLKNKQTNKQTQNKTKTNKQKQNTLPHTKTLQIKSKCLIDNEYLISVLFLSN